VEFNHDGELLATGDKGGRVVIFQRDPMVSKLIQFLTIQLIKLIPKTHNFKYLCHIEKV